MKLLTYICCLLATITPLSASASATTEPFARVGTFGFQFINIATDPRAIGMGLTGAADVTARAQGYNPAALAMNETPARSLDLSNRLAAASLSPSRH